MKANKKISLLIAGLEDFKDVGFVTTLLEHLHLQLNKNIGELHCAGVPGEVEQWARSHQISLKLHDLKPLQKLKTFPDMIELPEYVLKSDRYFQKGKNLLNSLKIDLVVALPSEDGQLGASAWDVVQFAKLANVKTFDCTSIVEYLEQFAKYNTPL